MTRRAKTGQAKLQTIKKRMRTKTLWRVGWRRQGIKGFSGASSPAILYWTTSTCATTETVRWLFALLACRTHPAVAPSPSTGQSYDEGEAPIKGNEVSLVQYICETEGDEATSCIFKLTPIRPDEGATKHGKRVWIFKAHNAEIRLEWQHSFWRCGCGVRKPAPSK